MRRMIMRRVQVHDALLLKRSRPLLSGARIAPRSERTTRTRQPFDDGFVLSSRPSKATNSAQQGRYAAAMRVVDTIAAYSNVLLSCRKLVQLLHTTSFRNVIMM